MSLIALVFLVPISLFLIMLTLPRDTDAFQLISGVMEVIGINILLILLLFLPGMTSALAIFGGAGLGIWQLIYVIPRSLILRRQRQWEKLKGVLIATAIILLLYGGCWILMSHI